MHRHFYTFITTIIFWLCTNSVFGQAFNPYQHAYQGWNGERIRKASPIRAFLNKFSLNASLGYGRTFYSNVLNSDVLETPEKLTMLGEYSITGDNVEYTGIVDWLNAPAIVSGSENISPESGNRILSADSAAIKYAGSGFNIPFRTSIHLDIDRFRIGAGIVYELHSIKGLNPKELGTYPYVPNFSTTTMFRYFLNVGAKVYHLKGWDYHVDIEIGKVKYGKQYDKSALQNGIYFNLGVPMEYEFSEYFWVFVRPSFDFKNYTMVISPAGAPAGSENVNFQYNQPAFYLSVGVRMKLPEIKRCPVKSCRTQLKHVHGGREFRGQPFYKKQNPKIGELYPNLLQNKPRYKRQSDLKN